MSSILTTESIVLLLLFNKLTKQSIFLFFVWVIRVAFRCSGRGGRFRIFLNFPIFLWIPSVRCILLSLFKRTRQSTPFSCYTATATGQHGKRELPDEDFARVLRGLHRARHQLRLLQISSSSRPAPLDHSHSHWVREGIQKKTNIWQWTMIIMPLSHLSSLLSHLLILIKPHSLNLLGGDQLLQLARQPHHNHSQGNRASGELCMRFFDCPFICFVWNNQIN